MTLRIVTFYNNQIVLNAKWIKILGLVLILILAIVGLFFWFKPSNFNLDPLTITTPEPRVPPFEPANLTWQKVATSTPWETRDSHEVYEFAGKLWLTSGLNANEAPGVGTVNVTYEQAEYFNDIWSTTDGVNWVLETAHAEFPPIRSQSIIYYKDALYMMGGWSLIDGYNNGIWQSFDGKTWKQVVKKPAWEEREGQKIIIWNDRLWLMGGVNYFSGKTFNDVWVSDDGKNWTEVMREAPWSPRWDHAIAVFNNKLWLAGGMSDITIGYDDVWATSNGQDWEIIATSTPWGTKQGEGLITYKNYLWFIGGLLTKENTGDGATWYSADGKNWQKTSTTTPELAREDQGVILWQDKIWSLGGMGPDWRWHNDIWFSK